MKISFIILAHMKNHYLPKMIDNILRRFPQDELILIDNSNKGLHIKASKDVRIVATRNCPTGEARNRGASLANGDIFYFLDGDLTFSEKWAEAIARVKLRKNIDITGGRVIAISSMYNQLPSKYRYLIGEKNLSRKLKKIRKDYVSACNLIVSRDIFQATKGFPLSFGHSKNKVGLNEEVLLQDIARKKGCSVFFDPDISVIHHWEGVSSDLFERAYLQGKFNQLEDRALNKSKYSKRYFFSKIVVLIRKLLGDNLPKKYMFDYCKGKGYIDALRNL